MNESGLPLFKSGLLITEIFDIPQYPNIPTSCYHYFHEENMSKTFPGSRYNGLHVIMNNPIGLALLVRH
jgi:hypothetical protein